MSCWFWNIDLSNQEYFNEELLQGRLRQGWGYLESLNLHVIQNKMDNAEQLNDNENATWTRCASMLNSIQADDLIAVKNLPSGDVFTLVRVAGDYQFSLGEIGDYGHFLPVEIVSVFNKHAAVVPAPLVNALNREQYPIRVTYMHEDAVTNLSLIDLNDGVAHLEASFEEKLENVRSKVVESLKTALSEIILTPRNTEKIVLEMLRRDGLDVMWNAGPNERGADILATVYTGYGLYTRLAIQVKMHQGIDNDLTGINQIEQAFQEHGVDAGLLVTLADELGNDLQMRVREVQQRYNVQVLYGIELYLRLLKLVFDDEHEFD